MHDEERPGPVAGWELSHPGSGGAPEAELAFTLTGGRSMTLVMTGEQTDGMICGIHSISKHVWSEHHVEDGDPDDSTEGAEVPDVSEVRAGPS